MVKVYDFSVYAARRAERNAAFAVNESIEQINQVGEVIQLKKKINAWYVLYSQQLVSNQ